MGVMDAVESPSMATNLPTRASQAKPASTQVPAASLWPTLGQTPMAASSSFALARPHISTANMWCSAQCVGQKTWQWSQRSRKLAHRMEKPARLSRSLTAVRAKILDEALIHWNILQELRVLILSSAGELQSCQ